MPSNSASTPTIYNSLKSSALDVIALTDPSGVLNLQAANVGAKHVSGLSQSVAEQFNQQRLKYSPAIEVLDLEEYIDDIIIETTVQGSSFLEVHLVDPYWNLLQKHNGAAFFDVDAEGFLWPPIELNFPPGQSDAVWVLCQLRPSTDLSGANLIATFEDKIVSQCRDHDQQTDPALASSRPNETRAEFIERAVKTAVPNVKFVTLFDLSNGSPDQFVFSASDLTQAETNMPASYKLNIRQNPNKTGGLSHRDRITAGQRAEAQLLSDPTQITIGGLHADKAPGAPPGPTTTPWGVTHPLSGGLGVAP